MWFGVSVGGAAWPPFGSSPPSPLMGGASWPLLFSCGGAACLFPPLGVVFFFGRAGATILKFVLEKT